MRISDWSSDVCSSDLRPRRGLGLSVQRLGSAIRPGTSDVGGFKRGRQIVVNDLERAGIGVIDAGLLGCQPVFDDLIFDPFVGQRASGIEAERFEVAGEHFHRGDATGLDRSEEHTSELQSLMRISYAVFCW